MTHTPDALEQQRLENLYSYGILDTEAEQAFDQLAADIAFFLQVPSAFVSFMDRDRQWFKACMGFSKEPAVRENTFCQYAILSDDPLVVEDTHQHPLFHQHPAVVGDPFIRAYLAAPVVTPQGFRIGTVCAMDYQPRTFTPWDQQVLLRMAQRTTDELLQRLIQLEHQQMFQASPTGFVVLDSKGCILSLNPAASQVSGQPWTAGAEFDWSCLTVDPQASVLKPVYCNPHTRGYFTIQNVPLTGGRELLVLEDTTDQIQYQLYCMQGSPADPETAEDS